MAQIHSFACGCLVFPTPFISYVDILVQFHSLHLQFSFPHFILKIPSFFHHMCVCSVAQLSPTLCRPKDCRPPGFRGIFQARRLEWDAISYSWGSSWPEIKPMSLVSPVLVGRFFTTSTIWETSIFLAYSS